MNRLAGAVLTLLCCGCVVADDGPAAPAAEPVSQPAAQPADAQRAFPHVRIDLKQRRIVVDAEVCLRDGALELLMCKWSTKEHESILRTRAMPSQVHFGLVAMGLTPGRPAEWIAPATEDGEGQYLPPRGPRLKITLRWKGADGREQTAPAGTWLRALNDNGAPMPTEWVFVGSDFLPSGGYWADAEGDFISVANFLSSVIDVPFESSTNNALLEYGANTKVIPPLHTAVEILIEPLAGAEACPYARVVLEIDRFGRFRLDGQAVSAEALTDWAIEYLRRHEKGQVVIRSDARSLAHDVDRAREALLLGGVRDILEQRAPLKGEMLPRTAEEKKLALAAWAQRFAEAGPFLPDPVADARAALKQVEFQLRELQQQQKLWEQYARKLREMLRAYEADHPEPTSRPIAP